MKAVGKALGGFFGGGSTYFYLSIGIVIVAMYGYINFLEARLDTVKTQRDNAIAESNSKGAVVNSQNKTHAAEQQGKKEADDAKNGIADSPDPINYAFDWVRQRREEQRNSDE